MAGHSPRHRGTLLFLFFASGGCGLIYEVLWLRYLTAAFGVTVYATSTVLAAFMGGLALGSYAFGRWAEHRGSPLRSYGYLEIGIGLYALIIPYLLGALPSLYRAVYQNLSDDLTLSLIFRFVASFVVLLFPTAMMGATLPVLSKFFAAEAERVGQESGKLYAWNTLGAVLGTVSAAFVLIPSLGVFRSNALAASANLLIGLTALLLTRREEASPYLTAGEIRVSENEPGRKKKRLGNRTGGEGPAGWALVVIGLSGFAALGYEVIWSRIIAIITFNTVFAFSSMLAAFLTGISLGSYFAARTLARTKNLWALLGALQLGIGIYALLSPYLFGAIAESYYRYQLSMAVADASWGGFVFRQFLLAVLLMLGPTILMGASFPPACRLYATGTGKTAAGVGDVYASNTAGAVLGAVATGLLLVPALGLKGGLMVVAALNLLGAAVMFYFSSLKFPRRLFRVAFVTAVAVVLYGLILPVDVTFKDRVAAAGMDIVYHGEDATGVVEVFQKNGHRFLVTNRLHTEGSDIPDEIYKMRKQGYLPLLLHPNPESMIEIGLGSGIGFVPVAYEKVKTAEMVEISRAVVNAAALFADQNQHILDNDKVKLRIDDGRSYLLLTPRSYDLIVLGLFTPYRQGVGYLYTREFYLQCREKLNRGGMVFQWLALSQLPPENLRVVINTFRSVFPNVYIWEKGYYIGLLGMVEELKLDVKRFKGAFRSTSIREDLQRWQLDNPYNFLASYVMGPEDVARFVGAAPLNTEDNLWIEFRNPNVAKAAYSLEYAADNLAALLEHRGLSRDPFRDLAEGEWEELGRYFAGRGQSLRGLVYEARRKYPAAYEAFRSAEETNPKDDIARFALKKYRAAMSATSRREPVFRLGSD